jgi:hypothetical protein
MNCEMSFSDYWLDEFLDDSKRGSVFKVEAQNYAGLHSDSNLVSEQLQVEDRSSMQMGAPKCEVVSGTKVRVSWRMPDQMPKEPGVHFVLQVKWLKHYVFFQCLFLNLFSIVRRAPFCGTKYSSSTGSLRRLWRMS